MQGKLLGGRYRIQNEIGEGGMAFVYAAIDEKLNRHVAVKVLHQEKSRNKELRARFENEAQAVSRLDHPNIIKIYDFSGSKSEQLWIVMEFVNGWNLVQFLRKMHRSFLNPVTATCIIAEICKALSRAHNVGLVHRDIKPENIMITKQGHIKLMDFGIVKNLAQNSMTQSGVMIGSPSYMSPEQIKGQEIDLRSDLYSLSVLYYELVTGRLPFVGTGPYKVYHKIIEGNFTPPKEVRPSIPDAIESIILEGMQKRVGNRHQSASEIYKKIEHFLRTENFSEPSSELTRYLSDPEDYERMISERFSLQTIITPNGMRKATLHQAVTKNKSRSSVANLHATEVLNATSHHALPTSAHATQLHQEAYEITAKDIQKDPVHRKTVITQGEKLSKNEKKRAALPQPRSHKKPVPKIKIAHEGSFIENFSQSLGQIVGFIFVGLLLLVSIYGFWQINRKIDEWNNKKNTQVNVTKTIEKTPTPRIEITKKKKTTSLAPVSKPKPPKAKVPNTYKRIIRPRVIGYNKPKIKPIPAKPILKKPVTPIKPTPVVAMPSIKISSTPASFVYINGNKVGATNSPKFAQALPLKPGPLTLMLKRDGYKTYTKKYNLKKGDKLNLNNIKLQENTFIPFTIKSKQIGVFVSIYDAEKKSKINSFIMTSYRRQVKLEKGTYEIVVEYNNKTQSRFIRLSNATRNLEFEVRDFD